MYIELVGDYSSAPRSFVLKKAKQQGCLANCNTIWRSGHRNTCKHSCRTVPTNPVVCLLLCWCMQAFGTILSTSCSTTALQRQKNCSLQVSTVLSICLNRGMDSWSTVSAHDLLQWPARTLNDYIALGPRLFMVGLQPPFTTEHLWQPSSKGAAPTFAQ